MPVLPQDQDTKAGGRATRSTPDAARILVVDDCSVSRSLYVNLLELHGFQVSGAENGREATHAAMAGQAFDVILMDINMPGCDGIEAARELRERGYKGIIYAFTGNLAGHFQQTRVLEAFDDYVRKPLSQEQILEFLRKLKAAPLDAVGTPAAISSESSPDPK